MQFTITPLALFWVFLGLRLSGAIHWEWVWVFAPLWCSAASGIISLAILGIAWLVRGMS